MIHISIYQSNFLSPNNITIDASTPNQFTATIQGSICDSYQLIIYDMSNVVKLDTTKISIASTPLYQNDTFTYTLTSNVLTNGNEYTWKLITWQSILSATSRQTPFFAYSVPTLTMTVPSSITSKSYSFQATYSQTQSILLNYWTMTFLDSNNNILLTTSNSYSGNISYLYDGFISGNSYKIYTTVVNQQGVTIQSPTYTFSVSYGQPNLNIVPTTTVLTDLSAVQINWSAPIVITGAVTGTSSYVNGLFNSNNTGLKLNVSSNIEYDLTIPIGFTVVVDYIPDSTFVSGVMVELDDVNGNTYLIGYNGTQYYYTNNSVTILGKAQPLLTTVQYICIKGIEVLIISSNQIYDDIHP